MRRLLWVSGMLIPSIMLLALAFWASTLLAYLGLLDQRIHSRHLPSGWQGWCAPAEEWRYV